MSGQFQICYSTSDSEEYKLKIGFKGEPYENIKIACIVNFESYSIAYNLTKKMIQFQYFYYISKMKKAQEIRGFLS